MHRPIAHSRRLLSIVDNDAIVSESRPDSGVAAALESNPRMRSQSRRRTSYATWIVGIALSFGVAGCTTTPTVQSPTPTTRTVPQATSVGLVVGGLEPCSGIFYTPGRPFAAGTIVVLRGTEGPDGALPTTIVATQTVGAGARFQFSLPAGQYVLVGHYSTRTSIAPWVQVTVAPSRTTTQNIPNRCA